VVDLFENDTTRKWAAPVLGAVTIGVATYVVLELPSSIPRTVGRRIKASVAAEAGSGEREVHFVDVNAQRISRETRKVLKIASWDLKERFRGAMEERTKEVQGAEEVEKKALKAKGYFENVGQRTLTIRETAQLESLLA